MHIATQQPVAKFDGRFLTLIAKSGSETIELAMEPNEAKILCLLLREATEEVITARAASTSAQIIAFPSKARA